VPERQPNAGLYGDAIYTEDLARIVAEDLPYERLSGHSCFITGATGLIGSTICKALLYLDREGGLDIRVRGLARNPGKARQVFGALCDDPHLELVVGDVLEPLPGAAPKAADYIFHTAAVTASAQMIAEPTTTLMTAIAGTKNLLDYARSCQTTDFIYLSSMEAYGVPPTDGLCLAEEDLGYVDLSSVRSDYPEGKRVSELLCTCYGQETGRSFKVARLAQTFGAGVGAGDHRVYAQFAKSAMAGRDIVLQTKGEAVGNYCYLSDCVRGLFYLLFKGAPGATYNVSNQAAHSSIKDMAELVAARFSDGRSRVVVDIPADDPGYAAPTRYTLDNQRLQDLGWQPQVDLEQMYARLIASYREREIA
jgi:nucleoside-diphosphate-sugar epimerase